MTALKIGALMQVDRNTINADQIPSVAEPLFQDLGAKVEFHPVMVLDDLKKAIQNMQK